MSEIVKRRMLANAPWIDEPIEQAELPMRRIQRDIGSERVWLTSERRGLWIFVRPWYAATKALYRSPGMFRLPWWKSLHMIWKLLRVNPIPPARLVQR